MKVILTSIVVILCGIIFAQEIILEENFESAEIPSDWKIVDNDSFAVNEDVAEYTDAWIIAEDPENEANFTASSTSYFSPANRADRWLITPKIQLGENGNYIAWKGMSYDPSFTDSYKIMISTTSDNLEDFTDTLALVTHETPYWSNRETVIEGYENEEIYLAFVNTTYDGYKLFLDSISVRKNDPLAVESETISLHVFPNPFDDQLTVSAEETTLEYIEIFNALGQEMHSEQITKNTTVVELSTASYSKGVYFVNIQTPQGIVRKKLIK